MHWWVNSEDVVERGGVLTCAHCTDGLRRAPNGKRFRCDHCGGSGLKQRCYLQDCADHGCCAYGDCLVSSPVEKEKTDAPA